MMINFKAGPTLKTLLKIDSTANASCEFYEKNKYPDKKHDFFKTLILLIRVTKFPLNWIQLETDPNQTIII